MAKTYKIELSEERLTLLKGVLLNVLERVQDSLDAETDTNMIIALQEEHDCMDDLLTHVKNETE